MSKAPSEVAGSLSIDHGREGSVAIIADLPTDAYKCKEREAKESELRRE